MVSTLTGKKQEDFIAQLLRNINEGQTEIAVKRLREISDKGNRFEMLRRLLEASDLRSNSTWELRLSLGTMNALARAPDLSRARSRGRALALVRASELANALALDLDLARSRVRASDLAHDLAHVLSRDLARTGDLTRASTIALDLARALAFARADVIQDFAVVTQIILHFTQYNPIRKVLMDEIQARYRNRLAGIYDEIQFLKSILPSPVLDVITEVIWDEMTNYPIPITLEGASEINADVLSEQVAPFMQAIQGLQEVHAAITEADFVKPRIIQMHNEFPKIEIIGAEGILRFLYGVLNKEQRDLDRAEQRAKIEEIRANTANTKFDQMVKIMEIQRESLPQYLKGADEYLRQNYPQLTDEQRLPHVSRIAEELMRAERTELGMRFGWHDRPRTLPEENQ